MRSFRRVDGTVQYLLPQVVAKERKLIQRCSKNFPNEIDICVTKRTRAREHSEKHRPRKEFSAKNASSLFFSFLFFFPSLLRVLLKTHRLLVEEDAFFFF